MVSPYRGAPWRGLLGAGVVTLILALVLSCGGSAEAQETVRQWVAALEKGDHQDARTRYHPNFVPANHFDMETEFTKVLQEKPEIRYEETSTFDPSTASVTLHTTTMGRKVRWIFQLGYYGEAQAWYILAVRRFFDAQ